MSSPINPPVSACFLTDHKIEAQAEGVCLSNVYALHTLQVCGAPYVEMQSVLAARLDIQDTARLRLRQGTFDTALLQNIGVSLCADQVCAQRFRAEGVELPNTPSPEAHFDQGVFETLTMSGFRWASLQKVQVRKLEILGGAGLVITQSRIQEVRYRQETGSPSSPRTWGDWTLNRSGLNGYTRLGAHLTKPLVIHFQANRELDAYLKGEASQPPTITLKTQANDPIESLSLEFIQLELAESLTVRRFSADTNCPPIDLKEKTLVITGTAEHLRLSSGILEVAEGAEVEVEHAQNVEIRVKGKLDIQGSLKDCTISAGPFSNIQVGPRAVLENVTFR